MELVQRPPLPAEYKMEIAPAIIFSLITCYIYNAYWNHRQFKAMNFLLGREEYVFWKWALLSLITCGIYHIYSEYKMGSDLFVIMKARGLEANPNLALVGLGLSCLGLTIAADAIYQHELNRLT